MKTYCQNCDHPNDLGHLFCVKCGVKLVLENVQEDLELDRRIESTKGRLLVVLLVIVVALVGLAVLAVWPSKASKRDSAVEGHAYVVDAALSRLQVMAEVGAGPLTNQPMKEEDINAWLGQACGRAGVQSMAVSLKPDSCVLHIGFQAGPWALFKRTKLLGPFAYSRDFSCGVTSNGLVVTGARVGHLPMVGPLVAVASSRVAGRFKDFSRERFLMSRVVGAKIEDGQITLAVKSSP
jgi:hypothetical protein